MPEDPSLEQGRVQKEGGKGKEMEEKRRGEKRREGEERGGLLLEENGCI